MSVYRSNKNIYVQLIDDNQGVTLVSASTVDAELRDRLAELDKTEAAREVGKIAAERAKEAGFSKVVFDRNGYLYHGRVAAVADGAREAGLEF
jgi:large subunit ribosomal protein L18